jgi:hypothetical protein
MFCSMCNELLICVERFGAFGVEKFVNHELLVLHSMLLIHVLSIIMLWLNRRYWKNMSLGS